MIDDNDNKEKKSPLQRFLFFIGILFLILYCTLGLLIIFWRDLPLEMEYQYRIALGLTLIIYAVLRFWRLLKQ